MGRNAGKSFLAMFLCVLMILGFQNVIFAKTGEGDNLEITRTAQPSQPADIVASSADVASIRLIEGDYIEIRWTNRMNEAAVRNPGNYKVTAGGAELELDSRNCYYYDSTSASSAFGINLTSLKLKNPLTDEQRANFSAKLQIVGDIGRRTGSVYADKAIIYDVTFIPFYTKEIDIHGIKIHSSDNVTDANLQKIAQIIEHMLKKDQSENIGITEKMVELGADVGVHGTNENAFFIPGQRSLTVNSTAPAAGLGGTVQLPTSTFSQSPNRVVVHEFGHAMKGLGIARLEDKTIIKAYDDALLNVKEQNMYPSGFSYALSNGEEFFAEFSTVWFDVYSSRNNNTATGREAMQVYDPQTYAVFETIYTTEWIPGDVLARSSTSTYRTPATRIFVPEKGAGDTGETDYDFGSHYFKFYSYLNSHVITDADPYTQVTTWWDFSNSGYGYNFDGLSWIVTPVTVNGVQYYRFVNKGYNSLNEAAKGFDGTFGIFENGGYALAPLDKNVVGAPVGLVDADENDDSQLWELIRVKGRYSQIVNKASGLAITTESGGFPGDGSPIVLAEYEDVPFYGQQWRLMRLKRIPSMANNDNLTADKYAIEPIDWDIKMKNIRITADGFIEIIWPEEVDGAVAGNTANYRVTVDGVELNLDPGQSTSSGNTTMLKLASTPTAAVNNGIGTKIGFTGNMSGLQSGLPVNNQVTYNFRQSEGMTDEAKLASAKAALTWNLIKGGNFGAEQVTTDLKLPVSMYGAQISWASNNAAISALGAVKRPASSAEDEKVKLTAAITIGGLTETVVFELTVKKADPKGLKVTTDAANIKKGDYFNVSVGFEETAASNAAVVALSFDPDKFEYRGNTMADGVTLLNTEAGDGVVYLTVMVDDYAAKNLLSVMFSAKEDAALNNDDYAIGAYVKYVLKDSNSIKTIEYAYGATTISTFSDPFEGKTVTLIDLSNIIDIFGYKKSTTGWDQLYKQYDFDGDGEITIADIVHVARLIEF